MAKQDLRDRSGLLLGWRETSGSVITARDRTGSILGTYDPRSNQTRDRSGGLIGTGDLLAMLIVSAL